MTDAKQTHTPGPWHITDDGTLPIKLIALDGRWKDRPGTDLASIGGTSHDAGNFQETLANARLIAAAPDLLAACEAIEKDADWTGRHADRQHTAIRLVRAAIAKAEGRS